MPAMNAVRVRPAPPIEAPSWMPQVGQFVVADISAAYEKLRRKNLIKRGSLEEIPGLKEVFNNLAWAFGLGVGKQIVQVTEVVENDDKVRCTFYVGERKFLICTELLKLVEDANPGAPSDIIN